MSDLGEFAGLDNFDNEPDKDEDSGRDEFSNTDDMNPPTDTPRQGESK